MINKFTIWGHWPPHAKSWLIGKDFEAGRDWGQEEKGTTEDEKAGWHRLDRHEFEWTPGDGDGQGGLACCHSWGCKESDTTEQLNWTDTHMESRLQSRLQGEILITSDMQIIPLMAESKEELNRLLMKVKEESEKAGLKLNIQKTKIMASSPITSWQIDGETMETVRDFIFGGAPK